MLPQIAFSVGLFASAQSKEATGVRQSLRAPRVFLHAGHLGFAHPASGEWVEFDAPLPADLATVLAALPPGQGTRIDQLA